MVVNAMCQRSTDKCAAEGWEGRTWSGVATYCFAAWRPRGRHATCQPVPCPSPSIIAEARVADAKAAAAAARRRRALWQQPRRRPRPRRRPPPIHPAPRPGHRLRDCLDRRRRRGAVPRHAAARRAPAGQPGRVCEGARRGSRGARRRRHCGGHPPAAGAAGGAAAPRHCARERRALAWLGRMVQRPRLFGRLSGWQQLQTYDVSCSARIHYYPQYTTAAAAPQAARCRSFAESLSIVAAARGVDVFLFGGSGEGRALGLIVLSGFPPPPSHPNAPPTPPPNLAPTPHPTPPPNLAPTPHPTPPHPTHQTRPTPRPPP
jgi:hypothetical protein